MELKGLPVGDPDTAVQRLFCGKFVYFQPLFRCDHPPRQAAAQHHGVARLQFLLCALRPDIAVILLIHAVKADQQEVILKSAGQALLRSSLMMVPRR